MKPASSTLLDVASEELLRLVRFDGTDRARRELVIRNLSRYFALYSLPSNNEELGRLLGSLERIAERAAEAFYRAAQERAVRSGSSSIRTEHVRTVIDGALPHHRTEFKEIVFFPDGPDSKRVLIEEIDLEAFRDTGFSWQILGHLAESELLTDEATLAAEPEAARMLGESIAAYGLLLLRLGGTQAGQQFARFLGTQNLREAAKILAQGAEVQPPEPSDGESNPRQTYFKEVALESGVRFRHVSTDWLSRRRRYGPLAPTFSGGGVTAGDLDGDGWPDLIYCGGQGCAAFGNQRDGSFLDITSAAGLNVPGEARMAVLADFDNDGKQDLFITYARDTNRLFHNLGDGRFQDLTTGSGLEDEGGISGPATAVDVDNDGYLDLYVGNFGDYMNNAHPWQTNTRNALPNRLYRNLGGLKFEDVTARAGVANTGWTQALSHLDYDLDGDQDLYIANDFGANDLLVNNGDGTFTAGGRLTGSADRFHGMNASFADLNRDGHGDILVTNIWTWNPVKKAVLETNTLLLSTRGPGGEITYERYEDPLFLQHDSGWSWAGLFFDYDNDADDDLYIANGFTDYLTFTQYRPHPEDPEEIYPINNGRGPNILFRNDNGMPITPAEETGAELSEVNSRSIALLDYDRDGDLDIAVSTFHSYARLFRNDGAPKERHWLEVELQGDPLRGTSRDAIGAQLIARNSDGLYVWRMRTGGEGYLGMSAPTLHLGLGASTTADLEIIWPGLERQEVGGVPADQRIRIRQGKPGFEIVR